MLLSSFSLHLVPEEARSASECFSEVEMSVRNADLNASESALKNNPEKMIKERKC